MTAGRPLRSFSSIAVLVVLGLLLTACPADDPEVAPPEDTDAEPPEDTDAEPPEDTPEEPPAEADFSVAVLFPGLTDDESWNQVGFEALQRAEQDFGIETAMSERVSPGAAEEAMRDFAATGFDLVIGHGGEFEDQALVVAEEFPDVTFASINGASDNGSNYAAYRAAAQEWKFVAGALAGLMTEQDQIGYIGGLCFPGVAAWVNGARDGAAHVNPDATFTITYTGDFEDSAIALETAATLIGDGADVLLTTLDEAYLGVIEAASGTDTKVILEHFDHVDLAPDNVLTSAVMPYGDLLYRAVDDTLNGTFDGTLFVASLADVGDVDPLSRISDTVPEDVLDQVREVQDAIIAGEITVEEDTNCP